MATATDFAVYRIPAAAPASTAPRQSRWSRVLLLGLLATLFFGPLAFGAVEDWSRLVLQTCALALFLIWAVGQILSRRLHIAVTSLYVPMVLFAAFVAAQLVFGVTAYRFATYTELWKFSAYGLLFFVTLQCLRRDSDLRWFVYAVTAFGLALAVFSLIQDFTSNGKLYWLRALQFDSWLYGPYVNHNHYAGLMEMLAPIPLVLSLSEFVRGGQRALLAFTGIMMAGSIFLSGSRGGMAAFVVQMIFLGAWLFAQRRGPRPAAMLAAVLLLTFAFLVWFGGAAVADRLAAVHDNWRQDTTTGRLAIFRDGLRMSAEQPVLGWGLGTFPAVYPRFRSFYTNLFVNQAHNDYLQVLIETGIVGLALTIWFLVLLYRAGLRRQAESSRFSHAVRVAALVSCTGIVVHSLTDFNLHIPANAAWFFVLCAVSVARVARSVEVPLVTSSAPRRAGSSRRPC